MILSMAPVVAGTTVYTSRSAWEAAASTYQEEDFDDGVLDPGISVTTNNGVIKAGTGALGPDNVWWDRLVVPASGATTTTWQFDTPLMGFGAYWDLAGPGGPGASIRMYLNGTLVGQEIHRSTGGSFWGVTNGPFDTVLLTSGSTIGWCETYEMDNMVYSFANCPPIADAGYDITLEQDSHAGSSVMLDGSGSYDPDGDPLTYAWAWAGGSATGVSPTVVFPLGTTTVTLDVSDGLLSDTDTVDIDVEDTTPPTITAIFASPDVLWQPNHKMIEVVVIVDCTDICDPDPVCYIVDVTSNEPVNGPGDGNTEPDWEITGDLTVDLRAERDGRGTGRVYTIHIECKDVSDNITTGTVEVTVPHDRGRR